jgi:hypothetical protein
LESLVQKTNELSEKAMNDVTNKMEYWKQIQQVWIGTYDCEQFTGKISICCLDERCFKLTKEPKNWLKYQGAIKQKALVKDLIEGLSQFL